MRVGRGLRHLEHPEGEAFTAGEPIESNDGPDAATNVVVTDAIPAGTAFVATPSHGTCNGTTTVTCTPGTIGDGAVAGTAAQAAGRLRG